MYIYTYIYIYISIHVRILVYMCGWFIRTHAYVRTYSTYLFRHILILPPFAVYVAWCPEFCGVVDVARSQDQHLVRTVHCEQQFSKWLWTVTLRGKLPVRARLPAKRSRTNWYPQVPYAEEETQNADAGSDLCCNSLDVICSTLSEV